MKLARSIALLLGIALPALAGVAMTEVRGKDWDLSMPMNGITFQRAKAMKAATVDRTSHRYSHLRSIKSSILGREHSGISAVSRAQGDQPSKIGSTYRNVSAVGEFSKSYAVQCDWDGTPTWLVLDTGSSDTWAVKEGFKCEDRSGNRYDQATCAFGTPSIDDFGHGEIAGMHFHLTYASAEEVSGPMGHSDLSCGGLFVYQQQVGLANKTSWHGDNITVGLLGLAYPSLTTAYYGNVGDESPWTAVPYSPFLTTAIAQGSIDPLFSLALIRNSSSGILAWGGLAPIPASKAQYARADLIIANLIDQANTAWQFSYYTIVPDGVTWGLTTDTTKYPYVVDSGTSLMFLPPPLVEQIAMSFQPRAVYLYQYDAYFAPCDAIAPHFAIVIGGMKFWINPLDMIHQEPRDPLTGYCPIGIASGGDGPYILGAAFLHNVLAVFDVGAAEMRFYPRE